MFSSICSVTDCKGNVVAHLTALRALGDELPVGVKVAIYPEAAIMLIGVEEPACLIHAPNESVDPSELERIALAKALFLSRYGAGT
jgi:acetylornithine deacetylase/succinyl-diaminopimelate desuccinylase-like protein